MNRYDWNNPPPPGTEFDPPDEDTIVSSQKNDSTLGSDQGTKQIDPPVMLPVPQVPGEELPAEKPRARSRSKSSDRRKRRKRSRSHSRWSRSISKDRRRRSRSRSRHRRRKYSSSRSRSRSPSYRRRQRRYGRPRSRSKSPRRRRAHRSRSNSRSHSRSQSYRGDRDRKSPKSRLIEERRASDYVDTTELDGDVIREEDMKIEDPEEEIQPQLEVEPEPGPIPFKNDGSFLEMFKRMQEQQKVKEEPPEETGPKKPLMPAFGKRRGGKVLKTGMVAKIRNTEEESGNAQDAWSIYMKEVRKYKEVHCDDDSKTRPLVK